MKQLIKIISVVSCIAVCTGAYGMGNKSKQIETALPLQVTTVTNALPTLVDLGADKCIPCKMMAPILEELKVTYSGKLNIVFYDVWKDNSKAQEYGIRAIPTQIFLDKDGKELFRHSGYYGKEEIMAKWSELGFDFKE